MYLKRSSRKKTGATYESWSLVESVRTPRGPRQRTMSEARERLGRYFYQYNHERLHQSLGYRTPASVYYERREVAASA